MEFSVKKRLLCLTPAFVWQKRSWAVLGLLLLVGVSPSRAEPLTGLFEATLPVMTQDASERKVAFEMGLIDVLIKNTGILQIATRSNINEMLADSETLVARYVYRTASEDATSLAPLHLNMVFDADAVRARLDALALPYWPAERPPVIVWLVIDQPTGRRLVGRDDPLSAPWRDLMQRHAARRGVNLVFPQLDEADWAKVQISDVWGGFTAPVQSASQRYGASQILTGVVNLRPDLPPSQRLNRWNFRTDFDQQAWSDSQSDARVSLEEAIDRVMASQGQYYTIRPGAQGQNQITLLFSGIRQPVQYARLQTFLSAQSGVSRLTLLLQEGDRSFFQVTLAGQVDVFFSALRNATFLRELASGAPESNELSVLPGLATEREIKRYHYEEGR